MITFDQYWLTVVISVFLPMVVALVTKQVASSGVKAIVLLALTVVTGALTQIQADGGTFDWKTTVTQTVVAFVIAVGVHYGLLKPIAITGSEGKIQTKVTGGIG